VLLNLNEVKKTKKNAGPENAGPEMEKAGPKQ